ncbi:hypothetical protein GQ43DRAFT_203916 [Delitschia confertaspora ATCC 74209]|uniref:Alpha-1,2-mannosyltransferase n=1 Tax=Delitschia confertaspora ATCC 74209 TaxID=1513339 RepID=A0A9P4MRY0_9PLEO|nr:hypothetical protein GQ43DRAFT_203916 [Delitschia confertaspora ATCC 74209]
MMGGSVMLLLAAIFFISSTALLVLKKERRRIIFGRFNFRRRRASGARTPPRSLSPGKKQLGNSLNSDYSDTFPPSRRFTLAEIQSNLPTTFEKSKDALALSLPVSTKTCLPLATSYFKAKTTLFTPTGFSTEEIKALGDFPDYAILSGVPLPQPYHDFNITKALPRPYRPFRWAYHQTMSILKMEPDWWLELENTYMKRIKQRQGLFAKHGKGVLQALPGSELVCKELMEMAVQFLCARYPQYFRLDKEKMVLYNSILNTETDIKRTAPLHVLLNNVPEDFAIMLRDPDTGHYCFRAGVICSALGWNVDSKIGLKLHEIHAPIPDYKEKMQFSMDRYFSRLHTDKPIQRASWGLEVDQPLYMPPGDPHEKHRDVQHSDLEISRCHLRVDWQTLRRLPLSGAIVFNFKALFTPVESFRDEPYVPALVLKILKEGKKTLMDYKSTWHTEHVVIPQLEKYAREQVQKGWVPEGWETGTLEESPYFPGWEEKWRREQGF